MPWDLRKFSDSRKVEVGKVPWRRGRTLHVELQSLAFRPLAVEVLKIFNAGGNVNRFY